MDIAIIKKQHLFASLIRDLLVKQGHRVEISSGVTKLFETSRQFSPEIIIVDEDLELPLSHFSRYTKLQRPTSKSLFLVFTDRRNPMEIISLIKEGGSGIVHYDDDIQSVINCIKTIGSGYKYLSPTIRNIVAMQIGPSVLSPAEMEVVKRVLLGQSTKEIALALCRSIETIQNHRSSIKSKLGIRGGKISFRDTLVTQVIRTVEDQFR